MKPKVEHRIEAVSFRTGVVDCTCGQAVAIDVELWAANVPAQLAEAWLAHRRAAGAGNPNYRVVGTATADFDWGRQPVAPR